MPKDAASNTLNPDIKGRLSIGRLMLQRLLELGKNNDNSPIYIRDLYKEFLLSGLDVKGQVSSGFNSSGYSGKVSVTGGIPDNVPLVNFSASGFIGATVKSEDFVIMQRQPSYMIIETQKHPTTHPISLMRLGGYSGTIEAGGSLQAAIGLPKAENNTPEAAALSLEVAALGTTAKGEVKYSGTYTSLTGKQLSYFRTAQDSYLQENFLDIVGTDKSALRQLVSQWIIRTDSKYALHDKWHISLLYRSTEKYTSTEKLLLALSIIITNSKRPPDNLTEDELTEFEKDIRECARYMRLLFEHKYTPLYGYKTNPRTVLDYIGNMVHWKNNPDNLATIVRHHVEVAQELAEEVKKSSSIVEITSDVERQLCYLSIWEHKPEGSASVTATAKLKAKEVSSSTRSSASASASISGYMKFTSYRLQTLGNIRCEQGPGDVSITPLSFVTQDTKIEYRQAQWSTKAAVFFSSKEKAVSEARFYNMMIYRSACVYWKYPLVAKTLALRGSGLCFGASVSAETLIDLAKDFGSHPNLTKSLCKTLRVEETQLKEFLTGSFLATDVAADSFPTQTLLIESALAVSEKFQISIDKNNQEPDKKLLYDMLAMHDRATFGKEGRFTLEAIRIRYRIADVQGNTRTLFQLGVPAGPVQVGITLSKINGAGNQGIIDVYVHWFSSDLKQFNQGNLNGKKAYEEAVPPVVLLHQ